MIFWIKKLAYITFAIVIISVCVNMFLAPHNIAAGGLTGLAIILEEWLGLSRTLVIFIGNGGLLVITLIFLGREVFINTVIGATMLPAVIGIVPRITLVNDTMLSMVVGSALFGVAVSILYHHNASSGGTAIPPLILKKHFNMPTSIGLFLSDGIIVVLCLFVFSIDAFFYAIASIFITSAVMSYIENGTNKKKMVYIISDVYEKIITDVHTILNRGVTIIPATGAYEKTDRPMLLITLDKKNYQQLVNIVNTHDRHAFMITDTVSDVHGRGFTYESGSV
jgi:uncharacterized membrane-anchored protein YitT (DUF2179 family)